jgi:RNA polymerase sigma-70 factor (ECF subfamily)
MNSGSSEVTEPSEGQLLVRHRNGDQHAFTELVSRYRAPVYSYLARTGIAPADRDDLFQEIFLRIHRSADQFRADRPLHPWMFTIVANTVRNHHRRQRVRQLVHGEAPGNDIVADGADSERTAAARETMAWLAQQLATLPEVRRQRRRAQRGHGRYHALAPGCRGGDRPARGH